MKITKRIIMTLLLFMLSLTLLSCNACKKNYDNVTIELDKTVMTVFLDQTQNEEGADKFKATILGLEEDMVDSFSYIVEDSAVATVSLEKKTDNISDFIVTPYTGGETKIFIISDETSSKQATLTVRIVEPLQNVEVNTDMTIFTTIDSVEKQISITPSNALKFTPITTSEKFYKFEILNYNSEVAVYDNTTNLLIIQPNIQQGILELKATFDYELEKNTFGEEVYNKVSELGNSEVKAREDLIIKVYLIKNIDSTNFVLSENNTPLTTTNGKYNTIELVQNAKSLCSKEIMATLSDDLVATEGFTYHITASCIDLDTKGNPKIDSQTGKIKESNDIEVSLVSEQTQNNVLFNISAVFQKDLAGVGVNVEIKEVEGFKQTVVIPFNIILIPEVIKINNDESNDAIDAVVYSRFENKGTEFLIEINPVGALERRFFIDVPSDAVDMIEIVKASDGIALMDKEILNSGTSVYIRSKNNATGDVKISIVALGTNNYENDIILRRDINLKLVIGAEKINTLLNTVYIEKGEVFSLEFSFDNNEAFTEYIYSKVLDSKVCEVPEVLDGNERIINIIGNGVGRTSVVIELSNGVSTTIQVICYISFEGFGVTLPSVNDVDSPVSEAIYTTNNVYDTTKIKTVTTETTTVKVNINRSLTLSILPYNIVEEEIDDGDENTENQKTTKYIYNEEANDQINYTKQFVPLNPDTMELDTEILKIDSNGYMTCLKEGTVVLRCTMTVFVNAFDGTDTANYGKVVKQDIVYEFTVQVIIPIESFEIIGGNITTYAYNKLSYFDRIKNTGIITVYLKITPSNATYNPSDIVWSVDSQYLQKAPNTVQGMSASYMTILRTGQNSANTAINVSLTANGRSYAQSKSVTINSPKKVTNINLTSVPNYTLDENGNKIPYIYFDGRKGLNIESIFVNLGAEALPHNAFNTNLKFIISAGLGGDPTPIVRITEEGNIIPISNGYAYIYVVAEDWFNSATTYTGYENNVRKIAVKVADGKTKATAIDIYTAKELMNINTPNGMNLNYVLQSDIDLTNYPQFNSFGLYEKTVVENDIPNTVLEVLPFTGTLDGCYNVFGTATQYKITGLSIKNTKYVNDNVTSLYYNTTPNNSYKLHYGLFAENRGELSNLLVNVSSIMISSLGLDDGATTNFGTLCAVNRGLIENCEVVISNLSGNSLYVNANTTYANIGVICGLNQGYIEEILTDEGNTYEVYDAFVNNCVSEGVLNVKLYSQTIKDIDGNVITGSNNTVFVGGLVGKNEYNSLELSGGSEIHEAKAVIQTIQDSRNEKYKNNHYSYYNGNITFQAEEMNARGTINITTESNNYLNKVGFGGIAGYSNGEILNIASEVQINALHSQNGTYLGAQNVGGIVGLNENGTLNGVYFSGSVYGLKNVGGICGEFSGIMENAITEYMDLLPDEDFAKTNILSFGNVGSLVGYAHDYDGTLSEISYSFARSYNVRKLSVNNYTGDILVSIPSDTTVIPYIDEIIGVGGLVGKTKKTAIKNSYAYLNMLVDDINHKAYVGGLVGYAEDTTTIENTYLRGYILINCLDDTEQNIIKDDYKVSALANNQSKVSAKYFYSTMGVSFNNDGYYSYVQLENTISQGYIGVTALDQISGFSTWAKDIWAVEENYNDNLPHIIYNERKMLTEPPTSIEYRIKDSTITSTSDLYKLNKFIKVDNTTILLFKYDNEDLNTYNINKILEFQILPYFMFGETEFSDITTIRLSIKTSNPSVADINTSGTISLYGEGTVQITISSMLNKNATTVINIVVMNVTTGFTIYKDNEFTNPILSGEENRLLIKKGRSLEIYPRILGNSNIMIEYSIPTSAIYPIMFTNAGDWTEKDLSKSCVDIQYSGTHVIEAINAGTVTIEARIFVYINSTKVYLPYTYTFTVQSFEGLNDFTVSHTSFNGNVKDRFEFNATVKSDIAERTNFKIDGYILVNNGYYDRITLNEKTYKVSELLDITIINTKETTTEYIYTIFIEVDEKFKTSEVFFNSNSFKIVCSVDDGQNIDYGVKTSLDVSLQINPQHVSSIETMFFSGAEVIYDMNLSNPMYNVAEVDTDVITAGEIGILKVFIYPEFAQIKNVYIYGNSTDGNHMSMEQVGLRKGTVPGQNTYFTLSPAPSSYSTEINGINYKGLHASTISNVFVQDSVIQSTTFDGYLYFKCLTGSDVKVGTIYTIYIKVEDYDGNFIINRAILYAEESVGITLYYDDSLENENFQFITSYDDDKPETEHEIEFITRRIGQNPQIEINFYDDNNVEITDQNYTDAISYSFDTSLKQEIVEGLTYKYTLSNVQIPTSYEGMTISIQIKAINTDDNNLIYYSNFLKLRVVPYIVSDIVVDGVNNKNEFNKPYGGNYNLNVNITTEGNCLNTQKMNLKREIASNSYTWWHYDYNEFEGINMYNILQAKAYDYFTISKNGHFYVYTPTDVGFNDKIYMVVSLKYIKGDADTEAGYVVETNAGPIVTEKGVNATSETLNFVLEFNVSSTYSNSEDNALPIYDKEGLESMEEGVYYILDNDIILTDWTPINTAIAGLDGNGYEINITNFEVNVDETIDCYLGLFSEISSNTVLKNLYVTYGVKDTLDENGNIIKGGTNVRYEFSLDSLALTTLYFGGIGAINNGTIYNCSVKNASDKYYFEFMRTDNKDGVEVIDYDVKIGSLAGLNNGSISHSRSEMTLYSNVGNVGGLVSENRGILSTSYYKNGQIINLSTNSTTSKVAGVCVTNEENAKIAYSYVEGTPNSSDELQYTHEDTGLTFAGNIAGFVYENKGLVTDSYSNIAIRPAGGRNAGFVFINNVGEVNCCYTLCKFIYANDNGTNASDTPFVGTDAQGNVNYNEENAVLDNVYYYVGNFVKSIITKEPAQGLTKVQFMENYYFGEFSFSLNDGNYTNYAYEEAYDLNSDVKDGEGLLYQNTYEGLDAVWTYDEYHMAPKLVDANNIAVSRKVVSFEEFIDVYNYYATFALGYANDLTVATNRLENENYVVRLEVQDSTGKVIEKYYSDDETICTFDTGLSNYYISMYQFNITPDETLYENLTSISLIASIVEKNKNAGTDSQGNVIYGDKVILPSKKNSLVLTPSSQFKDVLQNEYYNDEITTAMDVEYSTLPQADVVVSEKHNGKELYSQYPGTKGNPEVINNASTYNQIMALEDEYVLNGIYQDGYYRLISDIDFSNTNVSEKAVNNIFAGTFDGGGFTIENITLLDTSKTLESYGLFNTVIGTSTGIGVVKNLRVVPLKVNANYVFTVGTICAKVVGGRVYNIEVDSTEVTVKGKNIVGGAIGMVLDNILVDGQYYEFLSDDLIGVDATYRSVVQNVSASVNVNATSRVSSTNYYLMTNTTITRNSFYKLNEKVAYSGAAIGAVIQSGGLNRLNKAGVYDVKVSGKSIVIGEIIGTAIGYVGNKSYVDLVSVKIDTESYINASLIAGGVIGENRGLVSRATIEHEDGQELIDSRKVEQKTYGSQNIKFFRNAILAIGGVVGFNNGGTLENSYSKIDVRGISGFNIDSEQFVTHIAGGVAGLVVGGEFYNTYTSGSVYAKTIIGGIIGATSTPELLAPVETAVNTTSSYISYDSNADISTKKEVILDSVLGLNKWLEIDYSNFYNNVRNSVGDITDAYPIGAMIGSIQLNSKDETSSYEIATYNVSFKKLYYDVDTTLGEYFRLYDYGNKINSLVSSGVAYSNTQSSDSYSNNYAKEISGEEIQNNNAFTEYSTTIWEYTDRATTYILPALRSVSNLNTKKATLTVSYIDSEDGTKKQKTMLLIDGVNGEESLTKPLGTSFNPFKIVAPSQLRYFALHNNLITNGEFTDSKLYLSLQDNISLIAYSNWIPIADGIKDYKLTIIFNGNGYQISGITSSSATTGTTERLVGLFGYLQTGSIISDLRTKVRFDLNLEGGNIYVGGIVATAYNTNIKNCHTDGKINFLNKYAAYFSIGGIAGQTVSEGGSSSIENCSSSVEITSKNIISRIQKKVVGNSTTYIDSVYKATKVNAKVGGIAGFNQNSVIADCENKGSITIYPVLGQTPLAFTEPALKDDEYIEDEYSNYSVFEDVLYIGGIVGSNIGQIKTSTNYGTIYSYSYAGGIAGLNSNHGEIDFTNGVYNISRCINTGAIYLTAGYARGTTTAYAGGICAYSTGSINESINQARINVKTFCQFSVGGISGIMQSATNAYIAHSYAMANTTYNPTKNIIYIDSISKFIDKSKVEYIFGMESSSSAAVPNKAGLICNDGTNNLSASRIIDNMSYGDIYINEPYDNMLQVETQKSGGYVTKALVKNTETKGYVLEAVISKNSSEQITYGQIDTGKIKQQFGKSTKKTDVSYWVSSFHSVPDYITDKDSTIILSELRWNAKVFHIKFEYSDEYDSSLDVLLTYVTTSFVSEDGSKTELNAETGTVFYLEKTKGYILFELEEQYEIYYIMLRRSDTNDYLELRESEMISNIISVNGYNHEEKDELFDISPSKDVTFTITVRIRPRQNLG